MSKFQVRFKDTDPDSGSNSQDSLVAVCESQRDAMWVKSSLERDWFSEDGPCDPNREFYILDCSISL
jgi:hypothetical protein